MTVEYGAFDQARLPEQRALFDDAFPENRGTDVASLEHYHWKFHGSPLSPQSYEYQAIEGEQMLGYYAAIPYPYRIGAETVRVGMVCDVMTHSQARGRGVFTDLGRYATGQLEHTGLRFVTGYPIRPEVMGGHLRAGWQIAFELPMYLLPLRADAILASRRLGWLAPALNPAVRLHSAVFARSRRGDRYTASEHAPGAVLRSVDFEAFLDAWRGSVRNHLLRSADFYAWRLGAPGAEYRVFTVSAAGRIVAVAVSRETELHGIPSLALLDLLVLDEHRGALGALFHAIRARAEAAHAEAVVTMSNRSAARRHRLLRHGFLRSPYTFKLIVRSVSDEVQIETLCDEQDWQLGWIDSDDL